MPEPEQNRAIEVEAALVPEGVQVYVSFFIPAEAVTVYEPAAAPEPEYDDGANNPDAAT